MMEHFTEWIPKTVKQLRGDRSQQEIAERAGISVSYLSDIERGRTVPHLKVLDKIFTACGVTMKLGYAPTDDDSAFLTQWAYVRKDTLRDIVKRVRDIDPDIID